MSDRASTVKRPGNSSSSWGAAVDQWCWRRVLADRRAGRIWAAGAVRWTSST